MPLFSCALTLAYRHDKPWSGLRIQVDLGLANEASYLMHVLLVHTGSQRQPRRGIMEDPSCVKKQVVVSWLMKDAQEHTGAWNKSGAPLSRTLFSMLKGTSLINSPV